MSTAPPPETRRHAAMLDSGGGRIYSSVRMPSVTEAETTLLEAVRTLPTESQRAVLSYAMFLRHQEEARRLEGDEAAWDRHFSQPEKMARFAEWARRSLEQSPAEPLDAPRLC